MGYLRALLRSARIDRSLVELAAYCGDRDSRIALGAHDPLTGWMPWGIRLSRLPGQHGRHSRDTYQWHVSDNRPFDLWVRDLDRWALPVVARVGLLSLKTATIALMGSPPRELMNYLSTLRRWLESQDEGYRVELARDLREVLIELSRVPNGIVVCLRDIAMAVVEHRFPYQRRMSLVIRGIMGIENMIGKSLRDAIEVGMIAWVYGR